MPREPVVIYESTWPSPPPGGLYDIWRSAGSPEVFKVWLPEGSDGPVIEPLEWPDLWA